MHFGLFKPCLVKLIVAAIAANIGLGWKMEGAVEKAIEYVQGAIIHSYSLGKGNGPLNHMYRQRNLPFTPSFPSFSELTCSGKFYEYLLKHPRIQPIWHGYTRIPLLLSPLICRSPLPNPIISRNPPPPIIHTLPHPRLPFPNPFLPFHCPGSL